MTNRLAIFDFDGTITYKDSFLEFLKFYRGKFKFYLGFFLLSPIMVLFVLKIIPNWKAKEAALAYFFKGEDFHFFSKRCKEFSERVLPQLIRPKALEAILEHKSSGARLVVISASAENWLIDWCKEYDLELLATKLEVNNQKITGKINGNNCYGAEKECRLNEYLVLTDYQEIYVYGDSPGDKSILALATHPFYRHF